MEVTINYQTAKVKHHDDDVSSNRKIIIHLHILFAEKKFRLILMVLLAERLI
jgi:hypothetical protein